MNVIAEHLILYAYNNSFDQSLSFGAQWPCLLSDVINRLVYSISTSGYRRLNKQDVCLFFV